MSAAADAPAGRYGPAAFQADTGVSHETRQRFEAYAALLEKWSRAINLVGRGTLPDLWRRHMLDSAQLAGYLPPAPADRPRRILDLGSGAGFPGLVLALLDAGELHLVESDGRKATFLREVLRATDTAATVHAKRIEELPDLQADLVTARALAPLDRLLALAAPRLGPDGGLLLLKGRGAESELTVARKAWNMSVERWPSRSDRQGTVLRIEGLGRKNAKI
jgi:16S rRNA (guanine527-N7)-methyltransferase